MCVGLVCAPGILRGAAAAQGVDIAIVTESGTIIVALDPVHAPRTVHAFLHYVDERFYNGGEFFRAAPRVMIHGGNPAREQRTDPLTPYEPSLMTGLEATDGAIAMAGPKGPTGATSEFFICDGNHPELDGSMSSPGYAVFGHVIKGMNVVRAIARLPIAPSSQRLLTPVRIITIRRGL